jgi:DNA adenine methylase
LVRLIESTPVTPAEWRRQKAIFASAAVGEPLARGFATFFLNRTNHSGILNGGMIGGNMQRGQFTIDARFNRQELVRRLRRIAAARDRIVLSNLDAVEFLHFCRRRRIGLVYLDPPYHRAGRDLYLNAYKQNDHITIRDTVATLPGHWVLSYDDVPLSRHLYKSYRLRRVTLLHTAREVRRGAELMFFSPALRIPRSGRAWARTAGG